MIVWADPPGSAGGRSLQVSDLAEALGKLAHRVTIINARRFGRLDLDTICKADVIHSHGGATSALSVILKNLPRRGHPPVVSTLHGWHHRTVKDRIEIQVERLGLYGSARITVPNTVMYDSMPSRLKTRTIVIPNGVKCQRTLVGDSEAIDILWLGRVCEAKGIHDALAAFTIALRHAPRLRMNIVGPIEDREFEAVLRQAVSESSGRLRHTPFIDDPWGSVRADILLHTPHYDAFPRSVLEAMSAGVAVVATGVGGIPEMIEHETSGLLAPAHNAPALAAQLVRLATDDGLRRILAEKARSEYVNRFTIEQMASTFSKLYEQAAAG